MSDDYDSGFVEGMRKLSTPRKETKPSSVELLASVAAWVVVLVLLAALVIGLVWLARHAL